MIASTGPPPKSEETASASPEYIVKWSILASYFPVIEAVIFPKAILAPIVKQARAKEPRMTLKFKIGFFISIFL